MHAMLRSSQKKHFVDCKFVFAFLVVLSLITFDPSRIPACFVCIIPYQSLLDKVETSDHVVVGVADDSSPTKFKVIRVIKGDKAVVDDSISVELSKPKTSPSADRHLIGYSELDRAWIIETEVDPELMRFLIRSLELGTALTDSSSLQQQSEYYRFFVPLLEHANPPIADSAYNKLAKAPYAVLQVVGDQVDPSQLWEWIEDPQIVKDRGSLYLTLLGVCGAKRESAQLKKLIEQRHQTKSSTLLAPMLTSLAEIDGEDAVRFIEQAYILDRDRTLGEIIAAVDALRLHGSADGTIPRSRIMASYQLLLRERPALAELIIEDCQRWEEWGIAPTLMQFYVSGKQPWNNKMIVDYLQDCPLPSAKHFLARIGAADQRVAKAGNRN